jgi:putative peptidoglycan lipid II flippase
MVALNLSMDLTLIWPLAEAGLALSTAVAASVQVAILMVIFSRRKAALDWPVLAATAARTIVATMVMALAGSATMAWLPSRPGVAGQIAAVVAPLAVSVAAYLGAYRVLRGREPGMLWSGVVGREI